MVWDGSLIFRGWAEWYFLVWLNRWKGGGLIPDVEGGAALPALPLTGVIFLGGRLTVGFLCVAVGGERGRLGLLFGSSAAKTEISFYAVKVHDDVIWEMLEALVKQEYNSGQRQEGEEKLYSRKM